MANATIGALRVDLGLNSAQFTAGLKKSAGALNKFGVQLTLSLENVAYQLGRVIGALPMAVKGAIDHADALSKAAQKAGTTVEALSRLEYAAKLSDVSLESLTGGLQKLSRSMVDVAAGKGPVAAFKALGISVKEADGSLRSSTAVLGDVANRFARMEDGATKTALAIQLFGKSGAELIPLLNEGSAGLARMALESDRVGATISTKTAKAAEKFNDTLTRIGQIMQGVINKVMEAALPALQELADLLASPDFAAAAQQMAVTVVSALTEITAAIVKAINALAQFGADFQKWGGFALQVVRGDFGGAINGLQISDLKKKASDNAASWGGVGFRQPLDITVRGGNKEAPLAPVIADSGAAREALKAVNEELKVMNNSLSLQREEWEKIQEPIKAAGQALADTLGGLVSDLLNGRDAVGGLINAFKGLGEQLIQMALNQMITGFISSLFGGGMGGLGVGKGLTGAATYGFSGNGVYGIPGFDGGGFTGSGSRSGGMDGKGGFMAMLHPNETVIDHTRGGGGGESVVRIEMAPGLVGSILKQAGDQSVQIVKSQAPIAVAKANIDNRRG